MDDLEEQSLKEINEQSLNTSGEEYLEEEEYDEEDVIDLWVVRNSQNEGASQIEILTYENRTNCTNKRLINVCSQQIESLCIYNQNQIWCIDASRCLFVYW